MGPDQQKQLGWLPVGEQDGVRPTPMEATEVRVGARPVTIMRDAVHFTVPSLF